MALYLCGLSLKTPQIQLIHRKTITQIPTEINFIKYLINTHQNCESHQKQEKSDKRSQPRTAKGERTTNYN